MFSLCQRTIWIATFLQIGVKAKISHLPTLLTGYWKPLRRMDSKEHAS